MAVPTLDELKAWFNALDATQRVCRVTARDATHMGICGRAAVGIDRLGGRNALVCEAHKPREEWFIRLGSTE
jgi:hypothetical protein